MGEKECQKKKKCEKILKARRVCVLNTSVCETHGYRLLSPARLVVSSGLSGVQTVVLERWVPQEGRGKERGVSQTSAWFTHRESYVRLHPQNGPPAQV